MFLLFFTLVPLSLCGHLSTFAAVPLARSPPRPPNQTCPFLPLPCHPIPGSLPTTNLPPVQHSSSVLASSAQPSPLLPLFWFPLQSSPTPPGNFFPPASMCPICNSIADAYIKLCARSMSKYAPASVVDRICGPYADKVERTAHSLSIDPLLFHSSQDESRC